jgi:hypothetical protein
MYGDGKVDAWIQSRHILLAEPVRKIFTNDFMIRCGLADVEPVT